MNHIIKVFIFLLGLVLTASAWADREATVTVKNGLDRQPFTIQDGGSYCGGISGTHNIGVPVQGYNAVTAAQGSQAGDAASPRGIKAQSYTLGRADARLVLVTSGDCGGEDNPDTNIKLIITPMDAPTATFKVSKPTTFKIDFEKYRYTYRAGTFEGGESNLFSYTTNGDNIIICIGMQSCS